MISKSIPLLVLCALTTIIQPAVAEPVPTGTTVLIVFDAQKTQGSRPQFEFLRLALKAGKSDYRVTSVVADELTKHKLDDFAVVLLSDVSQLTDAAVARLEDFVSRGGGLIVFPGSRVNSAHYNAQLYRDGCGLLPAKLGRVMSEPTTIDLAQHVNAALASTKGRIALRQYIELLAISSAATPYRAGVLCPLADGHAAVIERNFGEGRCMLFATAVTQSWSDLWKSPLYLPLLHETVLHAIGKHPSSVPSWSGDCRWQFDRSSWVGGQFEATDGRFPARAIGSIKFDGKAPHAVILDGDSRRGHRLTVARTPQDAPLPMRQLTVDAWVKPDSAPKWGGIVGFVQDNSSYERGWVLGNVGRQFSMGLVSRSTRKMTYLKSRRQFEVGHWYYVAGVYDGRELRLYVDGELVGSSSEQTGVIDYPGRGEFVIGSYKDSNDSISFKGQIARVRVADYAETRQTIRDTFDVEKSRYPDSEPEQIVERDWPTHQRDNLRSGRSDAAFPADLSLVWKFRSPHAPQPAWPEPANHDFWHRRHNLKPRVVYDRAPHVVSADGRVFFGTTADDQVRCLNLETGKLIWRFFAEAPVRLAPTISNNKCLFGADDGYVYCTSADSGKLIWKHRIAPEDRRIPGNERVMSTWPVRTGVLVEDGIAFCCAGIFPTQGVYQAAINVETGKVLGSGQINVSAQGYLERRDGKLFVATGRDPAGKFVKTLARRGKPVGQEVRSMPKDFPYAFISVGDVRVAGGNGVVAAFHAFDGRKVWSANVDGKPYSLAYCRDRLLVGTDKGTVVCFEAVNSDQVATTAKVERPTNGGSPSGNTRPNSTTVIPTVAVERKDQLAAQEILALSGTSHGERSLPVRGYALVVNCRDAGLLRQLARQSELQIVAIADDATVADTIRRTLADEDLYGRVVVHVADKAPGGHAGSGKPDVGTTKNSKAENGKPSQPRLPFTDYMFNLIVDGSLAGQPLTRESSPQQSPPTSRPVSDRELERVLRPDGGTFVPSLNPDSIYVRSKLSNVGEWTHLYGNASNTVCSEDTHVGGPMKLQWFGRPGPRQMMDRHHRTMAPLTKNGRLYIPGNNRVIAVDVYNGTGLWNVEVPNSRRAAVFRDSGFVALTNEAVHIASGSYCLALDTLDGQEILRCGVPGRWGQQHDWGHVSVVEDLLLGSATKVGGIRRDHALSQIQEGNYYDFRPLVCSDFLFARNRRTGELAWEHDPYAGAIINSTISYGDGYVYFVESLNPKTLSGRGRLSMYELTKRGTRVVALNAKTGVEAWSQPVNLSGIQHAIYTCFGNGQLVIVGSRNDGRDRKTSTVLFDIHVFDGACGAVAWSRTQRQGTKISGEHGEQDHHPVVVGRKLICEPFAYDIVTGKPLKDWAWKNSHRKGCGTISASASSLFFRHSNPTMFDLESGSYQKVTTSSRPGCWINMIPAGGLLLVPEASSGCTCNHYPIQTSFAFLPSGPPNVRAKPEK